MPDSATIAFVVRLAVYLPLAFIAFQVVMLRRMLPSRAWTRLATGFVTVALYVGAAMLFDLPSLAFFFARLLAFVFIALGFHTLRDDLQRLRAMQVPPSDPLVSTTEEA
jgi:divalent metal cation (Fe/Co/Zn/Cd) transporter